MTRERANPGARGASASYTGYGDLVRAWRSHHLRSAGDALQRLASSPLQSLMTALVVAIALALPATLLVAMQNLERLGDLWDTSPRLSVFLQLRASDTAIDGLLERARAMPETAEVTYLSPAQALAQFQAQSGFEDALKGLDDNPLPPTLILTPTSAALEPATLTRLAERLRDEPLVDSVDLDLAWVRRLQAMVGLGRQIVLGLAGLLALGALLVIGNTVRLAIENRRDEIIVTKLVGGTDSFVRRPFLYTGLWYGTAGGVLATIMVVIGLASLEGAVARLASAYSSAFALEGLAPEQVLTMLAVSMLLGWLGAGLAVGRHLRAIEPR